MLDVEDGLFEFSAHGVDGFQRVILEDFLADFIPEIFLWIKFGRIRWKVQELDIVGKGQLATAMVGRAVENQKDVLAGEPARQHVEEGLKAGGVRRRHDQIDANSVFWRDCAVQIDVFANELSGDRGLVPIGAQHGRGRLMRPKRASSANMMRRCRPRLWPPAEPASLHQESRFFKSFLRREVALGMKRPRHQLAPALPVQEIVHRAVAGHMPDRLFIGRFEIVNVLHFAGAGSFGKARQQGLFRRHGHVLVLASAIRLGLRRLDATVSIGHVRAVHRAQRYTHRCRNRALRHPALA